MTGKEMVKRLEAIGFREIRVQGSHHIMQRDNDKETVPVHGNKDLKKGLEEAIKKRWGLK